MAVCVTWREYRGTAIHVDGHHRLWITLYVEVKALSRVDGDVEDQQSQVPGGVAAAPEGRFVARSNIRRETVAGEPATDGLQLDGFGQVLNHAPGKVTEHGDAPAKLVFINPRTGAMNRFAEIDDLG